MIRKSAKKSVESGGKKAGDSKLAKLQSQLSELKKLVSILERGKYMWESTFDAISSPVQIISKDYDILRANISLAGIAKSDIRKMIGRKCYEVFAGRDAPCAGCPVLIKSKGKKPSISLLANKISGREFEVSAYRYTGDDKGSVILHYRDVSEERRLQREVIQQEKMAAIGMLAGGVAHEINNPLGGIIAFAQLLKRDAAEYPAIKDDLDAIEEAAGRCKKIVADLLDFSRSSREGELAPTDLNVILEKVFPFIRREMQSLNVELIFDGAGRLPKVMARADRLQQVFLNLMTNACHSMNKGGKLFVSTASLDGGKKVVVKVRDTGHGISPDVRDQIFNPFFTTKEPGKGTGLGLSISYRIVREHGGTITFEDVKGGGTEFVVVLPASK